MTALVTEHLPLLVGAPDGIKKLRALILDLAIRGKLVSQDSADPPANELLAAARDVLSKEQKRRSGNAAGNASVDVASLPSLPSGWLWTRLADVALINPRNSADDALTVSFVPMAMIGAKFDSRHEHELRTWAEVKQGFTHFAEGDIGVAKITPCFENSKACVFTALSNGIGAGTTELHVVRPVADTLAPRYVLAYLKSPWFLSVGETKMTGTAGQKRLPKDFVENHPFPLPPLSEQHRIVAKVNELMALCDRLEADQADAEAAHAQLVQALLDSLTPATDAADFRASWQRLSEHFHTLFTTEASIDALKQTVLQLAVMGKVVPQDPSEGEACELIDLINATRAESSARFRKDLEPVPLDYVPFELPASWVWARIGQLALSTEYGLSQKTSNSIKGVPVLKMGDIQAGDVALNTSARVPEQTEGLPELYLESGDLLYNRTNSAELVGKTGIYSGPSKAFTFASYLIRIRFDQRMICPSYVNYVMNSPAFRQTQINPHLKQQCGQANVNGTIMRNMLVSLPPIAEQHRIVAKVDALMAQCNQLKARLAEARQLRGQLADLLVKQAVA